MIELVRRLNPDRWTVHVACFRKRGAWFDRVSKAVASVAEFPVDSFQSRHVVRHARAFAAWCRTERIAIVHTASMAANIFGQPSAALGRVPVRIANRREINPDKAPAAIAAQRASYAFAHKVIANSQAAAARLRRERVPARKIAVVANGLDVDRFDRRPAREALRRIVVVANLRREKGHDVLLQAAAMVLQTFPDARFAFAGGGPELEALKARAAALAVAHAVTFLGHQEDVQACLTANDIFVLPSRSEAFPNAVLEAMAAGMPIVASHVGGIPELVESGHTGMLVPPDDAPSLADRLCRFMRNPPFAARLGETARASAEARYSFDRMVAGFEGIYLSELARRGVVAAPRPELAAS